MTEESKTDVPEADTTKRNIFIRPLYMYTEPDETRAMTEDEGTMLITLTMVELSSPGVFDTAEQQKELKGFPLFQILDDRLHRHGAEADTALKAMIIDLSKTPGVVVMWAYTLHRMQQELGRRPTLVDFSTTYFPMGVPTEAAYSRMWDAQKLHTLGIDRVLPGPDNYIDYQEAWLATNQSSQQSQEEEVVLEDGQHNHSPPSGDDRPAVE